ncbi:FadR/GntR family transcriptional regulator [Proteocatella sphenisci]|uniref:FadR/GntR family transcriptional regulator n=1 Tax=Proteocatella sphenisci TaxID=181070 RepID=UPI00048D8C31|nr:FadR/GntR family transcriptional regulator [Proteocatella sphenisci]
MKAIKYSIPKQIADDIERQIKNNVFTVGQKLPTEPELVKQYGASRNTVREAVQSLIHAGILESKQGNGTYVIAKDRLQVDLFSLMTEVTQENIVEVRTLLEVYIVESAILHMNEDDIKKIEQCLLLRNNMSTEIKENTQADINFHISIACATHNLLLIKMYQYVTQFFSEFIASKTICHIDEHLYIDELHSNLVSAIKNKDLASAKNTIKKIINL